jgi:hypothetical protein
MPHAKHVKAEDQVDLTNGHAGDDRLDPAAMLGTWLNTDKASRGITKVVLTARGEKVVMHPYVVGGSLPPDWGEAETESLYGSNLSAKQAIGLVARFKLESMEAEIQANLNQGLLVIGSFATFLDGSGRSRYFSREFFHQ